MKPVKQRNRHDPENGIWGDCHRAAVASLLEMEIDDVPHFCDKGISAEDFNRFEREWFLSRGLFPIYCPYPAENKLSDILNAIEAISPGIIFLLGGESQNGCNHTVVAGRGRILHDPSQDDSGIIGPCNDGFYWITYVGAGIAHLKEAA